MNDESVIDRSTFGVSSAINFKKVMKIEIEEYSFFPAKNTGQPGYHTGQPHL